ncbi:MAG: hypothetical protein QM296_00405 [Bacillota bacterium]|nr:hypothetical protein [Bacillota bacterium]
MKRKKEKAGFFVLLLLLSLIWQGHPVLAFGEDVVINEANFPDANFRTYIRGFDSNGNAVLESAELQVVDKITCRSSGIRSLKGIEHFYALEELYCDNNLLESLDISHNALLDTVHCENNQLQSLDCSNILWLETLYCYDNQLSSLNLDGADWLKTLMCYNNQIEALDLSRTTRLEHLNCSNNCLVALDLSHNEKLTGYFTSCADQHCPVALYGDWDRGIYTFELSDILGPNISKVTSIWPVSGSTRYDASTGTLRYEENECELEIVYTYDVDSPTLSGLTMPVTVTLVYPLVHFTVDGGNGTITADKIYDAAAGEQVTLTVSPNPGYELEQLVVQTFDGEQVPVSGNRFSMPGEAVYVFASFKPVEPLHIVVFRTGNKTSYTAGETVALAARAEDGMPPYRYQFYVIRSNGSRIILRNYASSNIFNWVPVTPDTYRVGVNVKDASGKIVNQEKSVTVISSTADPPRIAVFRTGNKTNYSPGESVALAARAESGRGPYQYQFYVVRSNGSTVILRNFAYNNTFSWKPVSPDTYKIGVQVKDANGRTVKQEKNVTVSASKPLRVAVFRAGSRTTYTVGETVALAARGEGGQAPYRYQFYVYRSNGNKVILRNYSYSNIFNWKPASPDSYRVCVAIQDARGKVITKALYVTVKAK